MKTKIITLADLNKTDLEEQMLKVTEEGREAIDAFFSYNNAKSEEKGLDLISELYDLIQAAAGAIWILENGVSMNNEHIEKMEEYTETGRINNKSKGGVKMKIYKNNKNKAKYLFLYEISDCSEGRVDKEVVVYMNTVSKRMYAREKEEFYKKFTKSEE